MSRPQRLILLSMCLSLAAVVSAVSSLNVALPGVARATGATTTQLQWIVDAYALVFAGLLMPAGALGDRLGRRRVLVAGLVIFGGAALVATTVSDADGLIVVRTVMGVGAALIMPTTLSVITATFGAGERDKAVGAWAGVAGGSAMLGVLVSGLLLEWFDWPSVFALNGVLATVGLLMTLKFVPVGAPEPARLDGGGAALSALGLAAVVWAFIEGPTRGWTSATVAGGFALGVVLLVAFVLYELRAREPMLDPRLFVQRGFAAGSLSVFVQFFAMFGSIFVVLQFLQFVMRYSPLEAGGVLAPAAIGMIVVAPRVPRLVQRVGMRRVGPTGLLLIAGGLTIAATMDAGSSAWTPLAGFLVLGLGMALAAPPATAAIVASLPADKQGVASAVNDTAREVGGALGIAVLGSVLADHVGALGPQTDPQSLVDGYQAALHVGAAVLVAGAALVFARLSRSSSRVRSSAPARLL